MIEEAIAWWGSGRTDYGAVLGEFRRRHLGHLHRRDTVIVLGDARSNYRTPDVRALHAIRGRVRALVWLNPEPRSAWGEGDSEMASLGAACTRTEVCSHLAHLERVAESLVTAAR